MKSLSVIKQYLVSLIIQIVLITMFVVSLIFLSDYEMIVLNPVRYFVPIGAAVIVFDFIILLFIYRKNIDSNHRDI